MFFVVSLLIHNKKKCENKTSEHFIPLFFEIISVRMHMFVHIDGLLRIPFYSSFLQI